MNSTSKILILLLILTTFSCNRKTEQLSQIDNLGTTQVKPKSLKEREVVIEGTVISDNRGFANSSLYSSCLVEVNTIFKGEIKEKVIEVLVNGGSVGELSVSISHGQIYLPRKNQTAIFRIAKIEKDDLHGNLMDLSPFELYLGIGKVELLYSDKSYRVKNSNIEKTVYQKLEKESGRKRQIVLAPATMDQVAINYSVRNNVHTVPNRKTGVVYKLKSNQDNKLEGHIGFNLHLASTNAATYLQKGELVFQYNPEVFGDSIVSRGLLKYEIPRNYDKGNSSWYYAIPESWDVGLSDIGKGQFKIKWENPNDADKCLQLTPSTTGITVARLYFKPKDLLKPMGIRMTAPDSTNIHYDYSSETYKPLDYVATQELKLHKGLWFMPATITELSAKAIAQPLDTIQLSGSNFNKNVQIYLSSSMSSGQKRHRRIPNTYILSRSDSLLTFIIPHHTLSEKESELNHEWTPITGKIKLVKGYRDFEVITFSEEELVIKE